VTNVLRHAEARQCSIYLLERDKMVRLSIRNDGVRPPRRPDDAGQGLLNLAERVSVLGGWLEATSSRTGQFAFSVYVPRKQ
jgi:two-component system sensor histidine kinase DesK